MKRYFFWVLWGNNYSQFFLSNFIAKGSLPFCCSILEEIRFKSLKHSTILSGSQFVLFFIFNWTKQSFQVKKPVARYQMSPDFVVKCQNELNYLLPTYKYINSFNCCPRSARTIIFAFMHCKFV